MTDQATRSAKDTAGGLAGALPTDRLMKEARDLIGALGEKAVGRVTGRLGEVTERLTDFAEDGGGSGLKAALSGARDLTEGKSPAKSMMSAGFTQAKEKTKEAAQKVTGGGGGSDSGGGGKTLKASNIVESIDVGLPVKVVYNLWTQFEDFPTFMKKVENVKQQSETEMDWKAQVLWSHRTWKATVIEQVPDERILWESEGEKGKVDGAVTFHEVTPDLTRILLVLVYHPQGFFEKTGNIWRAQGRRARLELKHFRRHAMTEATLNQDEIRGWRGEVMDGEVTRSDEEVRAEEEGEEGGEEKEREPQDQDQDEVRDEEDEEPEEDDDSEDIGDEEYDEDEEPEDEEEEDGGERR
ncbi:SRPBCC family protein [Actinacidiphila acididurans]|uniref:SRPBCC family protein n=1 Tax=Actinacidiphila acididurans TaxID=2784346 RepID=A0ABS2TT66_9ACTN|nr:SRPBCC family protein [Actinacidiphila acididurans]MBM9506277.1 SRPBCC family protein [Actinacidiphila acididurans]